MSSREFQLEIDGEKTSCSVPYADMFNHAEDRQTLYFYNEANKGFVMYAMKDIKKGEQIFIRYR